MTKCWNLTDKYFRRNRKPDFRIRPQLLRTFPDKFPSASSPWCTDRREPLGHLVIVFLGCYSLRLVLNQNLSESGHVRFLRLVLIKTSLTLAIVKSKNGLLEFQVLRLDQSVFEDKDSDKVVHLTYYEILVCGHCTDWPKVNLRSHHHSQHPILSSSRTLHYFKGILPKW